MALFFTHTPLIPHSSTLTPVIIKPSTTLFTIKAASIPARDIVIDFGKHKGKMLGTLPSTYLTWVSNNLRARDFMHWAKLADSVLQDPVYQDRIEWEFAETILKGGNFINMSSIRSRGDASADAQLLEISERFGWDNENRDAWQKVDFSLLGTSKGGRIPRKVATAHGGGSGGERKGKRWEVGGVASEDELRRRERRRERRERVVRSSSSRDVTIARLNEDEVEDDDNAAGGFNQKRDWSGEIHNQFPGREGLLKKVISRKRLL
ncbi:hypothetical protein ACFE04_032007 [Oxalis oulophora]